jgi:WS/DGAT/MGAT family acyltransferase
MRDGDTLRRFVFERFPVRGHVVHLDATWRALHEHHAYPDAVLGTLGEILSNPDRLPITRFNAEVSPHRVFETRRFTLDEFKRIRALVPGATINDVVLSVCGGALRRYLARHDELPGPSLVAMAPLSIRNADNGGGRPTGLSLLRVPLGTEIDDPVRRLRTVHQHTANAQEIEQAVGAKELTDITKHAPSATLALSARLLAGNTLGLGQRELLASCTVTNVPGPAIPLYLNGARMTYFSAIMPISDGMGLVFAVTSYDGKIVISPTSCREQIPDPEFFALCIRESFQEYLELANRPVKRRRKPAARRKAPARSACGVGRHSYLRSRCDVLAKTPSGSRSRARNQPTWAASDSQRR